MRKKMRNLKGFTLVEIIVVIIIIGFLAALALPRFVSTIEYSRATEAMNYLGTVKRMMDMCSIQNNGSFAACTTSATIGIDDISTSPNSHFKAPVFTGTGGSGTPSATGYRVTLTRNTTADQGDGVSTIWLDYNTGAITRGGTTVFASVK